MIIKTKWNTLRAMIERVEDLENEVEALKFRGVEE